MRNEFADRSAGVRWESTIPDGTRPPLREPPADFSAETGRRWPPEGVSWPVPGVVATERLGTTGPELPPQT